MNSWSTWVDRYDPNSQNCARAQGLSLFDLGYGGIATTTYWIDVIVIVLHVRNWARAFELSLYDLRVWWHGNNHVLDRCRRNLFCTYEIERVLLRWAVTIWGYGFMVTTTYWIKTCAKWFRQAKRHVCFWVEPLRFEGMGLWSQLRIVSSCCQMIPTSKTARILPCHCRIDVRRRVWWCTLRCTNVPMLSA